MAVKAGQISRCAIYALIDPASDAIRYVGKASDPVKRLRQHLEPGQLDRYRSHKNSWIKGLQSRGLTPEMAVLEVVAPEEADAAERRWIASLRLLGASLTNGTVGGDGGAVTDPDAKARMGHRIPHTPEARARQSATHKRRCADPAERERLRSISNGKPPVHHGEKNSQSKLTASDVKEIRRLASEGLTSRQIAARFGVTYQNIWSIVANKTWKEVA